MKRFLVPTYSFYFVILQVLLKLKLRGILEGWKGLEDAPVKTAVIQLTHLSMVSGTLYNFFFISIFGDGGGFVEAWLYGKI